MLDIRLKLQISQVRAMFDLHFTGAGLLRSYLLNYQLPYVWNEVLYNLLLDPILFEYTLEGF